MLVANKTDLPQEEWKVTEEEAISFAESKGYFFKLKVYYLLQFQLKLGKELKRQ